MMTQPITVAPGAPGEIPAIADLIVQQETRLHTLDLHLRRAHSRHHIESTLIQQFQNTDVPLVARNEQGRVRGYVQPTLWDLPQTSLLHAFLTPRNGVPRSLTLPAPTDEDATVVVAALLSALTLFWQEKQTRSDLIRWPSNDRWLEPTLLAEAFLLDSICASTQSPSVPSVPPLPPSLRIRSAQPEDEAALLALFREELAFHQARIPFARVSPPALQAFQEKLVHLWEGKSLEDGAPLVLVVERQGKIIAMAENTLLDVSPDDEPGFTPPGRYGCIDNMSVREEERGRGIGRLLAHAVFSAFEHVHLDGYMLWYNPGNFLANRFWPHLGFAPLWTTYQRLHDVPYSA